MSATFEPIRAFFHAPAMVRQSRMHSADCVAADRAQALLCLAVSETFVNA
jgi:hypothetical protein